MNGNESTSEILMNARYLMKGENWTDLTKRVSNAIAEAEKTPELKKEWAKKFTEIIQKKEFVPASPFMMNAGVKEDGMNNHLFSCYVLPIEDSLTQIYRTIADTAKIFQVAGGVGYDFSSLRPKGCATSTSGGTSSGPLSFMRVFNASCNELKAGGRRKGAQMGVFRIDHPDIEEFINIKQDLTQLTNFNLSVAITDAFMQAVRDDEMIMLQFESHPEKDHEVSAKSLWDQIVKGAWKCGEPGLLFIDRANEKDPIGGISSTNPCWAKGTLIAHEKGLVPVEKIKVGDRVYVGKNELETVVKVFDNGKQNVLEIKGTGGYQNIITPDHKVCVVSKGLINAANLQVEDELEIQKGGSFTSGGDKRRGRLAGLICGDGSFSGARLMLSFCMQDKKFVDKEFIPTLQEIFHTSAKTYTRTQRSGNDIYRWGCGKSEALEFSKKYSTKKHVAPATLTAGKEFIRGYIEGLFYADGHAEVSNSMALALSSVHRNFLQDLQILLCQFKIKSSIYKVKRTGHQTDEKYGIKNAKPCYRLQISGRSRDIFCDEFELLTKHTKEMLKPKKKGYKDKAVKVTNITSIGQRRVFDFTTDGSKLVYANGIRSFDCGEQFLPPYGCCDLGSINLAQIIRRGKFSWDHYKEIIRIAVRFLDNAIDINNYTLPEIKEQQLAQRRIGLGVMGLADLFVKLGIPYDSDEALLMSQELTRILRETSKAASEDLAKEKGAFPAQNLSKLKDEPPLRNATCTTVAPTGSISIVAECSSGIEPIYAITVERRHDLADHDVIVEINPLFLEIAKKQQFYSEALIAGIRENNGSCQGVEGIPEDIQSIFKIAADITPDDHVKQLAAWQEGIDNAVSKTINLATSATIEDVEHIFSMAYDLGCKGITVYRDGCRGAQVLSSGIQKEERPDVVLGKTIRVPTSLGTMYITVGIINGRPFEVFVSLRTGGTNAGADAEGLARMVSLALRTKVSVYEIVKQLKGIGSGAVVFHKGRTITSIPDAIAYALEKYFLDSKVAHPDDHAQFASGSEGSYCKDCDT